MASKEINIICSCGSDKFHTSANPRPSELITCAKCGKQQRFGRIQRDVVTKVKKQFEKDLQKMFKKAGFK
ncbi:hypothetical protein MWMV10_MWMV10_01610 [Acinetobacter baumannii]|nr:hypothetical protein [Acinetobacter baumannii]CAI4203749.1 hypothetical protein MWMV10_MWMV10_01610 [Acinetobacter baumannii]CAI4207265.1 hypothetical protein MWMV15_MWMV15_01571 [Acinetobacter baumannii]